VTELLRLYLDIAVLRRGPEDLPVSAAILGLTAGAYFVVNFAVSSFLPPIPGPWLEQLAIDVLFTFFWYWLLLRLVGKPERYLQTASAVFGYQTVIAPLWISSVWLVGHFRDSAAALLPASLVGLAILVWTLTVNVRILRSALEWPVGACIGLVVLQTFAGQLLLVALFPGAPVSTPVT
jgi:hypothetical protein